ASQSPNVIPCSSAVLASARSSCRPRRRRRILAASVRGSTPGSSASHASSSRSTESRPLAGEVLADTFILKLLCLEHQGKERSLGWSYGCHHRRGHWHRKGDRRRVLR